MARFDLLPRWFAKVHSKFRTPVRTLVVFSGIALIELWLAGLSPNAYDVLANMYAFGAATAYMLVFVSLLVLRYTDPWTPRPFKVPLNIRFVQCAVRNKQPVAVWLHQRVILNRDRG